MFWAWSPDPLPSDPALKGKAVNDCYGRAPVEDFFFGQMMQALDEIGMGLGAIDPGDGGFDLLLEDRRSSSAAAFLWSDGSTAHACLSTGGPMPIHRTLSRTEHDGRPARIVRVTMVTDGEGPTITVGDLDPRVASVEIETDAGRRLRASVGDRRFLAWWPGSDKPIRVTATGADGSLLVEIERRDGRWRATARG